MKIKDVYPIISLVLFCFIVVPLFLYLIDFDFDFKTIFGIEGFTSNFSDYTTIDRIKTQNNKYAYCLGGKATCASGVPTIINDSYGHTYKNTCTDGSYVECNGNVTTDMTQEELITHKTPDGFSFPFSTTYHGFTTEYAEIPFDISDNYINYYKNGHVVDQVNKCELLNNLDVKNCTRLSVTGATL